MRVIKVEDLTDIDIIIEDETVDITMCAPIIDAVPVVRCKDCKHSSLKRMSGNIFANLELVCTNYMIFVR